MQQQFINEWIKALKGQSESCNIFGTFGNIISHINIGVNVIILSQLSLQSYLGAVKMEYSSMNPNDNALELIQLCEDIEKAKDL